MRIPCTVYVVRGRSYKGMIMSVKHTPVASTWTYRGAKRLVKRMEKAKPNSGNEERGFWYEIHEVWNAPVDRELRF